MSDPLVVLGLDPSLTCTGWCIMLPASGGWDVVASGAIQTKPENKKRGIYKSSDDARRIAHITDKLKAIIDDYEPLVVVSEQPSGGGKSSSAVKGMAFATAIVTCITALLELPLLEVPAKDSKKRVGGCANASKAKMQKEIAAMFPGVADKYKSARSKTTGFKGEFEDIADAIAAVITVENDPVIRLLK